MSKKDMGGEGVTPVSIGHYRRQSTSVNKRHCRDEVTLMDRGWYLKFGMLKVKLKYIMHA